MTLRTAKSDCDVRTRSTGFRVDLGTRYVTICFVLGLVHYRMTLRTAKSDRDVTTRSTGFRVDLGTRYVTICLVSLVAGRSGGLVSLVAGRIGGNSEQKKKGFSSIFTTDTKSWSIPD
jgi:hypothetical protein